MFDNWLRKEVFKLAFDAGTYNDCTLETIDQCLFQPIQHDKGLMWFSAENGLSGLMVWAALPSQNVQPFLSGDYMVKGDDFKADKGEMWIMDFIAPYGDVAMMMRQAQSYFARRYGDGTVFQWKRPWHTNQRLGYVVMRDKDGECIRQ